MVLLTFAALGFTLGYRFHTTRSGYAALALMALLFPLLQIADVILVRNRAAQTMLPLLVGMIMVVSTVLGAGTRVFRARFTAAARD